MLVGSRNPVKVAATAEAFSKFFDTVEVSGISVNSNVPSQPVNAETFVGARNRALEMRVANEARNFDVGFFELPALITKELLSGVELGDVMDTLIGEQNTKERQGAVGHFTNGVMDRKAYYMAGLVVASIPFLNSDLYF